MTDRLRSLRPQRDRTTRRALLAGAVLAILVAAAAGWAASTSEGTPPADPSPGPPAAAPQATPPSPDLTGIDLGEGWLGVALEAVEGEEATQLGVAPAGIRVTQVFPQTPAAASDIAAGDLIVKFGDVELHDVSDLIARVRTSSPGTTVDFTVRRGDTTFVQPVMLGMRPEFDELLVDLFVGKPAPPLHARQLADGTELSLGGGDIVVLDFWATWCGPCRRALPTLNALSARYAGRGVRFIGLSSEAPEELHRFLTDTAIDYTVAYDVESETTQEYFITAYPTLFVIDGTGTVRQIFIGGGDLPGLEASLEALVAERGGAGAAQ